MNQDEKINKLLNHFYSGDSSPEENALLNSLLSDTDSVDKKLLSALEAARINTEPPASFEENLRQRIAETPRRSRMAPQFCLKVAGIAASVALIILASIHFFTPENPARQILQDSSKFIAEVMPAPIDTPINTSPKVEETATKSKPFVSESKKNKRISTSHKIPNEAEILAAEAAITQIGIRINQSALKAATTAENIEINNTLKNIFE